MFIINYINPLAYSADTDTDSNTIATDHAPAWTGESRESPNTQVYFENHLSQLFDNNNKYQKIDVCIRVKPKL